MPKNPELKSAVTAMMKQDGFYLVRDINVPRAFVPVAVIGGKIYSMHICSELKPEGFLSTARISGPIT